MSSARNAAFVSVSQAGKIAVSLVSIVVLSRLLPPADFGVYAMIIAVVGIGELFRDFGLSLAAIQAPSISTSQRTALFWASTGIGVALTLVAIAASPVIGGFYGRADLAPLVCVAALTFALNGAGAQYRVELTRSGRFRDLAVVDLAGQGVSLTGAIVLAAVGAGAWALVVQAVLLGLTMLVALLLLGRWLPGRPRGFGEIRPFVGFGGQLMSVQLISYVSSNLDKILVGRLFGAAWLGLYAKAFQLYSQPVMQGVTPFANLAISVLSQVRDDPRAYLRRLLKLQLVTVYVGLAGFALMIALAEPLTTVALGPQWSATVPLFRILCIGGLFQILGVVYYWMFVSSGAMRVYLVCTFITQPIAVVLVIVGATQSTTGVAWGAAAGLLVEWLVPATWGTAKAIGAAGSLLAGTIRPLAVAAIIGLLAFAAVELTAAGGPVVQLLVGVAVPAAVVVPLMMLLPGVRADAAVLRGVVQDAAGTRLRRRVPA
ncbi:lipopolysaccharide biosynthesis protein [uncultured Amnibacterium sp.]|uniref:lipopolysaccharide biosynthesis protein n=1 Tax=uncultured Amnibacterium sp. TaxID=1631851 RepID=UPI0035CB3904